MGQGTRLYGIQYNGNMRILLKPWKVYGKSTTNRITLEDNLSSSRGFDWSAYLTYNLHGFDKYYYHNHWSLHD
jgi:hypothetical protein